MSTLKFGRASVFEPHHTTLEGARHTIAVSLRSASAVLARMSVRLARPAGRCGRAVAQLEFHAEAGASEGALYLDGRLVGWVTGVRRL